MKKNYILKLFIILLISMTLINLTNCKSKNKSFEKSKTDILIENSCINEPSIEAEDVIKEHYKYYNEKNEEQLSALLYSSIKPSYRFFNLDYIKLLDIKLISNRATYQQYIEDNLNKRNLDIEMIKIYKVTYDIKFIDETIEPIDSGENSKEVIVIKLSNSDKWFIEAIGS